MPLTLEINAVSKTYHGLPVLRECSFTFAGGLTYALLGANGSGKSTLLRLLALLEPPDAGEIRYFQNGRPVAIDLNLKRRFTLLLPRVGVFNRTVFQNVAYGLKVRGVNRARIKEKVHRLLKMVELADQRNQRAVTLSSGQIKRLGLARALAVEPAVLFLDEPTASIDSVTVGHIEDILTNLKNARQTTIILVTHDPAQAARLADHILYLQEGRLAAP